MGKKIQSIEITKLDHKEFFVIKESTVRNATK